MGNSPIRKCNVITLSATDVLAPTTMKNAAKCDTSCELHSYVSHQRFERTLHPFMGISVGVFVFYNNPIPIGLESMWSGFYSSGDINWSQSWLQITCFDDIIGYLPSVNEPILIVMNTCHRYLLIDVCMTIDANMGDFVLHAGWNANIFDSKSPIR